jgi:hypothetical protein
MPLLPLPDTGGAERKPAVRRWAALGSGDLRSTGYRNAVVGRRAKCGSIACANGLVSAVGFDRPLPAAAAADCRCHCRC